MLAPDSSNVPRPVLVSAPVVLPPLLPEMVSITPLVSISIVAVLPAVMVKARLVLAVAPVYLSVASPITILPTPAVACPKLPATPPSPMVATLKVPALMVVIPV